MIAYGECLGDVPGCVFGLLGLVCRWPFYFGPIMPLMLFSARPLFMFSVAVFVAPTPRVVGFERSTLIVKFCVGFERCCV